jgi:cystatin-A/B
MFPKLKKDIRKYTNREFSQFKAINFRRQSEFGTNYIVKVYVGSNEYIHVRFLRPLPCTGHGLKLGAVQTNKTLDDSISAF